MEDKKFTDPELQAVESKMEMFDTDEKLQEWKETLNIFMNNGFTEYQACIMVSQLMIKSFEESPEA